MSTNRVCVVGLRSVEHPRLLMLFQMQNNKYVIWVCCIPLGQKVVVQNLTEIGSYICQPFSLLLTQSHIILPKCVHDRIFFGTHSSSFIWFSIYLTDIEHMTFLLYLIHKISTMSPFSISMKCSKISFHSIPSMTITHFIIFFRYRYSIYS